MFGFELIGKTDLLEKKVEVDYELGNSTKRVKYAFNLPWQGKDLSESYAFLVRSHTKPQKDVEKDLDYLARAPVNSKYN